MAASCTWCCAIWRGVAEPRELIESAFERLSSLEGYVARPDQKQLALLLSDCIESPARGIFEAPTGLGKSLAALIPAVACAITSGKRIVISTYTNVLAEQYWRQDLPLALTLIEESPPKCEFLIGRQRYACLVAMQENSPQLLKTFAPNAKLGIESEFRSTVNMRPRELSAAWQQIAAPPVCPARLCSQYEKCFYYRARRSAERSQIVITNHSVVLQDAILARASQGDISLLGDYDFLVIDEAHDFYQAALGALEFELSESRLGILIGITNKLEQTVLPIAAEAGGAREWLQTCETFRTALMRSQAELRGYGSSLHRPGILAAAPSDVWEHPQVRAMASGDSQERAEAIAMQVAAQTKEFEESISNALKSWKGEAGKELADDAREAMRSYQMYIVEFGFGCESLFKPSGVSVSYVSRTGFDPETSATQLRHDIVGVAEPLQELIWSARPFACMSATLALDGDFAFFKKLLGVEAEFEEILPSPFDFHGQAALYLPKADSIPNPTYARKMGAEDEYYDAIAEELSAIITAMNGRTLALFHSRKEMEAVYQRMNVSEAHPIYMQRRSGAASSGEKFKGNTCASLFALRSFWTGFDAPGETLSCVVLVRVPFEVPVDPPQVARQAWLQSRGIEPFAAHTLPIAKMIMRQGAGRLIRRAEDRGVIAILDPRVQTKGYGEEILRNLPENIRLYRDIGEAVAAVGLEEPQRV